jgi:hypothetical protein
VQTGQWVGAGRDEDVLFAAEESGDRGVVQVQPLDQVWIASREFCGVLIGQDGRRVEPAEQVMLGALDYRVERVPLCGRGGGQVVVALDGRPVR